ncbi:hypothetical protein A2U01_0006582, partial [Trifolium medium]|nr:hypothetical protein [Trifolium medium]
GVAVDPAKINNILEWPNPHNVKGSAYEKELMALVLAVQHWRPYLLGRRFVVYSDHKSLRHLLQQRITTADQQNWIVKLLGYHFEVVYKPGPDNKAADALSRMHDEVELKEFHSSATGGHSGFLRTYRRIAGNLYWVGMRGYEAIFVVVDRLSKYGHFIPLKHPYTARKVAEIFTKEVVRLHGVPQSIVSDRDPLFVSLFWKELFRLQGTVLSMSSSYHPETDGQTEVVNRCLEAYLRCFASEQPKEWLQ